MQLHGAIAQSRHLIDEDTQVGALRRHAQQLAQQLNLDATMVGRVAIAATELASNLWRHGGGGELLLQPVVTDQGYLVELIAIDRGRGMENVERCMTDGYSTAGTPGTGLGAVRRLSSQFDIYSVVGEGTVVMARIGAGQAPRFGAINVAMNGESVSGDSWRLASADGQTSAMVVDGLGHGTYAAEAAQAAAAAFSASPFEPPRAALERAHRAMAGTRGAAAAFALVDGRGGLSYCGVGNIYGSSVLADSAHGLISHNGILGMQARRMQQFEYLHPPQSLLIMHSDGLSARWDLQRWAGLAHRHPALIAAMLYRQHARNRDDATVLVVG